VDRTPCEICQFEIPSFRNDDLIDVEGTNLQLFKMTYLVPRESIEINIKIFDINQCMRSICNTIYAQHGSFNFMDSLRNSLDIMKGSKDIAHVWNGDKFCFWGH